MKLSHITTAILVSASAILSAQAQAQTISVTPQTLIMNFAPGENLLERIAQPNPGQVSAITTSAPAAQAPAASTPGPAVSATAPAPAPAPAPATPPAAAAQPAAPANPVAAQPPVQVPPVIGGQRMGVDAQRVTKCLIEHHGDTYICGMLELNGEISKCVGGVGTPGGCFTAPLTRPREPVAAAIPRHRPHNNYYYRINNFRTYANSINIF